MDQAAHFGPPPSRFPPHIYWTEAETKKPLVLWDIIKAGDVWMSVSIPAWQKMEIEQLKINPDTSGLALEIIPLSPWKVQADTAQQRTVLGVEMM